MRGAGAQGPKAEGEGRLGVRAQHHVHGVLVLEAGREPEEEGVCAPEQV